MSASLSSGLRNPKVPPTFQRSRLPFSHTNFGSRPSLSPIPALRHAVKPPRSAPPVSGALSEGGAVGAHESLVHTAAPPTLPFVVALHHTRDLNLVEVVFRFERLAVLVEFLPRDRGVGTCALRD